MILLAWTAWLALSTSCIVSALVWLRRTREIVAPVPILVGTIGLYVLPRAAYLLWFGRAPDSSAGLLEQDQAHLIASTLAVINIGVLAFLLAHQSPAIRTWGRSIRFTLPDPDPYRAAVTAGLVLALGVAAFALLLRQIGGWRYVVQNQSLVSDLLQGKGILLNLTRVIAIPAGLLLIDRARHRTRWWVWLFVLFAVLCYAILGRRSLIAFALAYPLLLYHWSLHSFPWKRLAVAGVIAVLTLTAYSYVRLLGIDRIGQASRVVVTHPQAAVHFLFSTGEFRIFDATTIIVRDVPEVIAPNFGTSFIRVPWWIIPRTLWETKPVTLGETLVGQYMPNIRGGHPPMIFGELYAAGGIFAVILGMFCFGWMTRLGWEWGTRHRGVGDGSMYILFCYFVYDFTRVGDPSRTLWAAVIAAVMFAGVFCLSAPSSAPSQSAQ